MSETRLKLFKQNLSQGLAALISKPTDIFYLTSFGFLVPEEREAFLLVTPTSTTLFHHSFSPHLAQSFCQYVAGVNPQILVKKLSKIITGEKVDTLLIDKDNLVVSEWEHLKSLPISLENLPKSWLCEQKLYKDSEEIFRLTKAGEISQKAFVALKRSIKVGQTEKELAEKLKSLMTKFGSEREAFPTIVAFGANTALPHHQPTDKKLKSEMAVLFDFGSTYQNYRSDMTRSWWFGDKPDPEHSLILSVVKEAYQLGVKALSQKNPQASQIDQAVRTHINAANYGPAFIHTTGHSLGLDIHEVPSIYLTNHTPIPNSAVITIEPGIYLPGKFGVRYENTLLKSDSKITSLTGK